MTNSVITAASYCTHGQYGRIEQAYLGRGSNISQENGDKPHFATDVGFHLILDEQVAFSRLSTPNHENHLHHDPPMDLTEGLNRHILGVEATSHKITAENHIFAGFRFRVPSAADFVLSRDNQ